MELDYHDVTAHIDARDILRYLNDLGIRNISGEVLKYFITDLKNYIKHDLSQKYVEDEQRKQGLERLHSASTFCSRIRSRNQNETPLCVRECHTGNKKRIIRNVYSAPNLSQNVLEKPSRRACSCIPLDRKYENINHEIKKPSQSLSNNLIKVPLKKPTQKKCDPVTLYHYYLSMWQKYKSNVPGENKWADLRWSVRQKMAGCIEKSNVNKVTVPKLDIKGI